jgi:hypothetical protein
MLERADHPDRAGSFNPSTYLASVHAAVTHTSHAIGVTFVTFRHPTR